MGHHAFGRPKRAVALLAVLAGGALAGSLVVAPAASALLPTTTTVTASPAVSQVGDSVTLTAGVYLKPLGGLLVTPSGYVSFSAVTGSGKTVLGKAKLGHCLLSTCYASLTTTALPAGTTSVTGFYGGDLVGNPSIGSAAVTVTAPPPSSTTATCGPDQPCSTEQITSSDGQTQLQVDAPPDPNGQTITASLTNGTLHCPGDVDTELGALATFETTTPSGDLTVHYLGHNSVGAQMQANYASHTLYLGCFASDQPFDGYTGGVFGPAPFVAADGLYEAQLGNCANNSGELPCFTNIAGPGSDDEVVVQVGSNYIYDPKVVV